MGFILIIGIISVIFLLFFQFVFRTFWFLTGPWIKILHFFDKCYTTNTHNNLVALWAKACLGNMGLTNDKLSQYLLPVMSRIAASKFFGIFIYGSLITNTSTIARVNYIDKEIEQALLLGIK
jgi:hypothetical protein